MTLTNMELTVNLFTEGEKLLDLLKAAIRDWQDGWGHEQERAAYAMELYNRALVVMREQLEKAELRVEEGFYTEQDQRILNRARERLNYWEKKLEEITGKNKVGIGCR